MVKMVQTKQATDWLLAVVLTKIRPPYDSYPCIYCIWNHIRWSLQGSPPAKVHLLYHLYPFSCPQAWVSDFENNDNLVKKFHVKYKRIIVKGKSYLIRRKPAYNKHKSCEPEGKFVVLLWFSNNIFYDVLFLNYRWYWMKHAASMRFIVVICFYSLIWLR